MTQLNLLQTAWVSDNMATVLDRMRGREFTADDLHEILDEPIVLNHWGCLMAHLRPHLEKIGYRPSTRPARNGGVVAVWRVKP